MKRKFSKKLKKISIGFFFTGILVFAILLLGNIQNPYIYKTKTSAEALENIFYDSFFKFSTGKSKGSDDYLYANSGAKTDISNYDPHILIVDIDEASLAELGNYNSWDRSIHANVIKNLSNGGAAAISSDILFKNADFGKQKADQSLSILKKLYPQNSWDSLYPQIQSNYNSDSLLIDAIQESGNVISAFTIEEYYVYPFESQWKPLSTPQRAADIGFNSSFSNSQIDKPEYIESKDLLDNIFPEMAKASAQFGSVNAYPDDDGVLRHLTMIHKFPNTALYPNDSNRVYASLSLMTILHLFHQKPENVEIKMGKYINVGKPFGLYKDEKGFLHTTFPQFSYPMFESLLNKINSFSHKDSISSEFINISDKIIAHKDETGVITFELFAGQSLNESLSEVLLNFNDSLFKTIENEEEINLSENIVITKDSELNGALLIEDTENEEEASITPYVVKTIKFFADSLKNLKNNSQTILSLDMDIHFSVNDSCWKTNNVILTKDVLKDIAIFNKKDIDNLKIGEEIRFGKEKHIPIDIHGRYQVNYQGRYNTNQARSFQHLSYYNVSFKREDPAFYQGKICILGSAAPALFDFLNGPHEEHYPGVLVHATIIQNILNDKFLLTLEENYQQIIVILLALICMLVGLYTKSYISITISSVMMIAYIFTAYHFFLNGTYIGVSKQIFAILLTNILALIVQFYYENREKKFLDSAFKQYISPELINEMVDNEIMPTLGGTKSDLTAYFTDIASFSTFSEKIGNPSKLVELLNEYLTAMTDILLLNKGTLDKYEGDAIIAFFGAPMPLENHAQSACDTAVDMQEKLMKLRKKWSSEGNKWPQVVHEMHMRIGLNSGDIVTGNMGSSMRKNYTMMGDAVNLAARLESAAKQYGAYIQMSEDTEKHLDKNRFIYRSLDTIRVVGKSLPVKTFELLGKANCENKNNLIKLVNIWEQARDAYLQMNWDKAKDLFTQCLDYEPHLPERDPGSKTCPSLIYIKRCEDYKEHPPVAPGKTWDGIFTATSK